MPLLEEVGEGPNPGRDGDGPEQQRDREREASHAHDHVGEGEGEQGGERPHRRLESVPPWRTLGQTLVEVEAAKERHKVHVGGGEDGDDCLIALGVEHHHDGVQGEDAE